MVRMDYRHGSTHDHAVNNAYLWECRSPTWARRCRRAKHAADGCFNPSNCHIACLDFNRLRPSAPAVWLGGNRVGPLRFSLCR